MIKLNGQKVDINKFPDGTFLLKYDTDADHVRIDWFFESNEELVALIFLTRHLQEGAIECIDLFMPYIPNARQDRFKNDEDVFTLKYFCEVINSLNFNDVMVFDPHSSVSEALLDRITVLTPDWVIDSVLSKLPKNVMVFYPDEGAMKRYNGMIERPYAFGIKRRDWESGQIQGLDVAGAVEGIKGKDILIIDDICSKGGTFYHSAKKLKELGANKIYLYVSHCENTIKEGELLKSDLIDKIYTTNSVYTDTNDKITVFKFE